MKYCVPLLMLSVVTCAGIAWGQASATNSLGTVTFSLSVQGSNPIATIYTDGNPNGSESASSNNGTEQGYVGPYTYTFASSGAVSVDNTGGALTSGINQIVSGPTKGAINGFCIDLLQDINQAPYTAYVYSLGSSASSTNVYAVQGISGGSANANNVVRELQLLAGEYSAVAPAGSLLNPSSGTLADALQYAMWQVVTEPSTNPGLGNSYLASDNISGDTVVSTTAASGTPVEIANYWLANMNNSTVLKGAVPVSFSPYTSLYSLVPVGGQQIQSVVLDLGSFTTDAIATPEPMSFVAMVGLALCGLPVGANVFYRRRKEYRRRNAQLQLADCTV